MQSMHLVQTLRMRRNLKILIKAHRKRIDIKHNVNIRIKYQEYKLK